MWCTGGWNVVEPVTLVQTTLPVATTLDLADAEDESIATNVIEKTTTATSRTTIDFIRQAFDTTSPSVGVPMNSVSNSPTVSTRAFGHLPARPRAVPDEQRTNP